MDTTEQLKAAAPRRRWSIRMSRGAFAFMVLGIAMLVFSLSQRRRNLKYELLVAARIGDAAAVREYLDAGTKVDVKGPFEMTPLYLAAKHGHVEVVRILLELHRDHAHVFLSHRSNALDAFDGGDGLLDPDADTFLSLGG